VRTVIAKEYRAVTEARREQIVAELTERRFLSVQEIAARFACSIATARRDVQALAALGRLQRSHGGAMAVHPPTLPPEMTEDPESDPFLPEKQRIARAAAALVANGETVGLSGGTTTFQVARCLRGRSIGVVTNAVDVALEIAREAGPRLVLVGGVLDYAHGHELLGPLAEQALAQLNMDVLFVSVNGIRAGTGVTIIGELNAQVMRMMARRARRVVVVADHTKIGRSALSHLAPLDRIDTLVTDASTPSAELEAIAAAGVRVIEV
jgi:DeoR/GlpR family transcriptional regulator of sugar metabolism